MGGYCNSELPPPCWSRPQQRHVSQGNIRHTLHKTLPTLDLQPLERSKSPESKDQPQKDREPQSYLNSPPPRAKTNPNDHSGTSPTPPSDRTVPSKLCQAASPLATSSAVTCSGLQQKRLGRGSSATLPGQGLHCRLHTRTKCRAQ